MTIRFAETSDADKLFTLIDALAEYEKLDPPTKEAKKRLLRDGFGEKKRFETLLAEEGDEAIGYAIFFETYSTFAAKPTLYLEDLFVLPEHRGKKAGKELFLTCVRLAHERHCGRMEWQVLAWNAPAHDFYRRFTAEHLDGWQSYRLTEDKLQSLVETIV